MPPEPGRAANVLRYTDDYHAQLVADLGDSRRAGGLDGSGGCGLFGKQRSPPGPSPELLRVAVAAAAAASRARAGRGEGSTRPRRSAGGSPSVGAEDADHWGHQPAAASHVAQCKRPCRSSHIFAKPL